MCREVLYYAICVYGYVFNRNRLQFVRVSNGHSSVSNQETLIFLISKTLTFLFQSFLSILFIQMQLNCQRGNAQWPWIVLNRTIGCLLNAFSDANRSDLISVADLLGNWRSICPKCHSIASYCLQSIQFFIILTANWLLQLRVFEWPAEWLANKMQIILLFDPIPIVITA